MGRGIAIKRVDTRHPELVHGLRLGFVGLIAKTLYFQHQVEGLGAAIVEPDQEIRDVAAHIATIEIRNLKSHSLMGWTAPAPGIDVPKWLSLNTTMKEPPT